MVNRSAALILSEGQTVELLGSGRSLASWVGQLTFANLMHGFDSRQEDASTAKGFEAQHRPTDTLDESMSPPYRPATATRCSPNPGLVTSRR